MRWKDGRRSGNVEDRRGISAGTVVKGGGGLVVVVIAVISILMGGDPAKVIGQLADEMGGAQQEQGTVGGKLDDEMGDFVSVVLADTEDTWNPLFEQLGQQYQEPRLVIFSDAVQSACGFQQSAVGPFYCPADKQVYLDLTFFRDLDESLGAPGEFAQAYVIAHEVGHHVQTLLGISADVHQQKRGKSKAEANALSVKQELQADCFAGIWAHHADRHRQVLEVGDMEAALNAASAIGDDRLQKRSSGQVVPESFTHGTSEQRMRWFKRGFDTGKVRECDTFLAKKL